MIDFLVGSLMVDGGLELVLYVVIIVEIQDIEVKKEVQKEKEIDEQEVNVLMFYRSRMLLDKDFINMGICEFFGKQCLFLVQFV